MEACYKDFVCVENAKVMALLNILRKYQRYSPLGCAFLHDNSFDMMAIEFK